MGRTYECPDCGQVACECPEEIGEAEVKERQVEAAVAYVREAGEVFEAMDEQERVGDEAGELRRQAFLDVAGAIGVMKAELDPRLGPELDQDLRTFLGIVRDMAVHVSRGNQDRIWGCCREMGHEFGGVKR